MKAQLSDTKRSVLEQYALVDTTGAVVGLILWDGKTPILWNEFLRIQARGAQIGWRWLDRRIMAEPAGHA